jgi:hypothetical protein
MRQFVLIGRSNHPRATFLLARPMPEDMQRLRIARFFRGRAAVYEVK